MKLQNGFVEEYVMAYVADVDVSLDASGVAGAQQVLHLEVRYEALSCFEGFRAHLQQVNIQYLFIASDSAPAPDLYR